MDLRSTSQRPIASDQCRSGRGSVDEVLPGGETFDVVDGFVKYSSDVCDNAAIHEVRRRITAANRPFFGLRNQLMSHRIRTKTKQRQTLMFLVILYFHEL